MEEDTAVAPNIPVIIAVPKEAAAPTEAPKEQKNEECLPVETEPEPICTNQDLAAAINYAFQHPGKVDTDQKRAILKRVMASEQ